jgi:hypothetical protein
MLKFKWYVVCCVLLHVVCVVCCCMLCVLCVVLCCVVCNIVLWYVIKKKVKQKKTISNTKHIKIKNNTKRIK